MKYLTFLLALLVVSAATFAQSKDKKNIEKLCGCFDVEFKYAETFSPDKNYKYHDRERLGATELVIAVETTGNKYVLQHLLLINDSTIIKHWREDWEYEQPVLFAFEGDKHWTKRTLNARDVKNKWTQTVWEVDDAPRYQGVGEWITTDGKTFWESTTDAPLPRREYTVRNDYNIMQRGNRIIVDDAKWVHEQDNRKIRRTAGTDTLLAEEKGFNTYTRTDASKCEKARKWWDKNSAFWDQVRIEWESYLKNAPAISLKSKVDNKRLSQYLNDIYKQWMNKSITAEESNVKTREVIGKFIDLSSTGTVYK